MLLLSSDVKLSWCVERNFDVWCLNSFGLVLESRGPVLQFTMTVVEVLNVHHFLLEISPFDRGETHKEFTQVVSTG